MSGSSASGCFDGPFPVQPVKCGFDGVGETATVGAVEVLDELVDDFGVVDVVLLVVLVEVDVVVLDVVGGGHPVPF